MVTWKPNVGVLVLTPPWLALRLAANVESACWVCVLSCFSRLTLCAPMNSSPPGSSVHGILQARILQWIARPSSPASDPVSVLYHLPPPFEDPHKFTNSSSSLLHCHPLFPRNTLETMFETRVSHLAGLNRLQVLNQTTASFEAPVWVCLCGYIYF